MEVSAYEFWNTSSLILKRWDVLSRPSQDTVPLSITMAEKVFDLEKGELR